MTVSVFDIFKVGIGPSSSHTVGPMRAARQFVRALQREGVFPRVTRVLVELDGSLSAAGRGRGSDKAVLLGLGGHEPDTVDVDQIPRLLDEIRSDCRLLLDGVHPMRFDEQQDLIFHRHTALPFHANGMRFQAFDNQRLVVSNRTYYSVGGGLIVSGQPEQEDVTKPVALALPFETALDLLTLTEAHGISIAELMRRNEHHWRTDTELDVGLLDIWQVMQACVARGCRSQGVLPGGLSVKRRAAALASSLGKVGARSTDPLRVLDWVNLFSLAVSEENAAGGRVVAAPTNRAAGVVPAVLHYYVYYQATASDKGVIDFLLTAAAIGILYKGGESFSGAGVGCQGEVGMACSMAAGALCAVLGGSPAQVEHAAEIGMKHHLGLTCDPVGVLVQIPCIERNATAAVMAINAARLAMHGGSTRHLTLDKVIKTMREAGANMVTEYKEPARGRLAVNVVER